MTPTYLYYPEEKVIREQPTMKEPDHTGEDYAIYVNHVKSRRAYPAEGFTSQHEGIELIEEKDFIIIYDKGCSRHHYNHSDERCDGKDTAIPIDPEKEIVLNDMEKQKGESFYDYIVSARNSFVNIITKHYPHLKTEYGSESKEGIEIRVAVEDVLIAYDQMKEELSKYIGVTEALSKAGEELIKLRAELRDSTNTNRAIGLIEAVIQGIQIWGKGINLDGVVSVLSEVKEILCLKSD